MQMIMSLVGTGVQIVIVMVVLELLCKTVFKHTIVGKLTLSFIKYFYKLTKFSIRLGKKTTKALVKNTRKACRKSSVKINKYMKERKQCDDIAVNGGSVVDLSSYIEKQKQINKENKR